MENEVMKVVVKNDVDESEDVDFRFICGTSVSLPSVGNNDDNVVFIVETSNGDDVARCEEVIVLILGVGTSGGVGLLVEKLLVLS